MAAASKPKNPPQTAAGRKKPKKSAKAKIKKKPRKLRLKGWLKSPEDWAKFNAWAAVNALPRKQPEPEPIVRKPPNSSKCPDSGIPSFPQIRPSKPLPRLKKRIAILSKPSPSHGEAQPCVTRGVSKAALKARASRRTKKLARPNWKDDPDDCREWTISRAALLYEPSENIANISRPVLRAEPEDCKPAYALSRGTTKRKTTEKDEELARPKRAREAEPAGEEKKKKKDEEVRLRIFNRFQASESRLSLDRQLSPWVDFLSLPAYRVLKDQESEQAIKWKARILDEIEVRGKQALEEQTKKREEEQERQKKIREAEAKEAELEAQKSKSTVGGEEQNVEEEEQEAEGEEEEPPAEKVEEDAKSKSQVQFGEEKVEEDEETKLMRRMEKEPWRFTDSTCKQFPLKIPESALNYEATKAIVLLSQPKKRKAEDCIEDPFKVKESAKSASASPKIEELAKPKYPVEPKERAPPREKDQFGRPIFPRPVYGKVLPKVEPYQMGECKDDRKDKQDDEAEGGAEGVEEENDDNKKQQENQKKKPIDPIANAPTIDPIFDPSGAAKQARERKRAAEQAAENRENEAEKSVEEKDEEVADAPEVVVDEVENEDENVEE
ncbi:hypothetical protein TSAR_009917 [Trichomalopsis sarcophagae]|uniref:Uncharacterized protein n=1 Tax=Trichomalopsis sarcophagae TaxID=543379 RepID=A0A232FEC0_9HYME|nr:hypothetical protein TSAR_009917 [Trichomalopsis sarcophagae]